MQCQNNLKQLALGCHTHHDLHYHFPVGTAVESAGAVEDRLAWTVAVLPYIEQANLLAQIDRRQGWKAARNQPAVSTRVKLFRCASDHRTTPEDANVTAYVGVAGAGTGAATLPVKHRRAGYFGYERKTKLEEVKDGASNTLLLIETTADNGPWAAGGPATVRGVDPEDEAPIAKGGAFGVVHSDTSWNWGRIPVWANAAMGDGSVRRVDGKISGEVLAALATIAGGESLPADW
jgi:hypothetical protein